MDTVPLTCRIDLGKILDLHAYDANRYSGEGDRPGEAGETLYQPKMAYAIVTFVHEHKTMAIYMEDLTLGTVL